MSKDECISFLSTHPGHHILPEIAGSTGQNLETARKMLTRLWKDGAVKREYPEKANEYIRWWV